MKNHLLLLLLLLCVFGVQAQTPPSPDKKPYNRILQGDTLPDPYHWLHNSNDRKVLNYLSAENGYIERMMRDTKVFQEKLVEEMRARYPQITESLPSEEGGYYYYSRFDKDQSYPVYYRRKGSMEGEEELVIDMNDLARGNGFIQLEGVSTSPSQEWLAFAIDYTGSEEPRLELKNLRIGIPYNKTWEKVAQFTWANDQTLFYTVYDTTHRPYQLYKHTLFSKQPDELIFESDKESISIGKTESKEYLILQESGSETDQSYYLSTNTPNKKFKLFAPKREKVEYSLIHPPKDKYFYVGVSENGVAKVYRTPVKSPSFDEMEEVWAPDSPTTSLEGFRVYKDYMAFGIRKNGLLKIWVQHREKPEGYWLDFGEKPSTIGISEAPKGWETNTLRFYYSSYITPGQTIDYNLNTRQQKIVEQEKVYGKDGYKFNPDDYVTERVWATARDGVKVPISIAYKKNLKKDGTNPCLLIGYGAYGMVYDAAFSREMISLLDRGFIIGQAHIRGSGYLGNEWYKAGKMLKKKNSFNDFIDASHFLIDEGFTSTEKLIAMGGSAGGMLMGGVANQKPELYKGIIASVPAMDLLNVLTDTAHYGARFHFTEWGNPLDSIHHYEYVKSYSPYENVKAQDYPNMLMLVGFQDSRVRYYESVKYLAKLREMKTDDNLLFLQTTMEGGHGLGSGQFSGLKQQALQFAFMFKLMGIASDYALVSGVVKDADGEPLPFANVIIDGTSNGTTTNDKGEYALALRKGKYKLRFQFVGFEPEIQEFDLQSSQTLNIELKTENILMKAVTISDKYNDPAYGIIKKAQENRKKYRRPVEGFKAQAYMKTINRFDEMPKKIPAFIPKEDIPDSTDLGLIYLSESQAKVSKQYPDDIKEEMISSKVAGNSQGYSWNRVMQLELDFYENLVEIVEMNDRGFVSPIASNSLLFYRYEYLGEMEMHGQKVNKIRVIPRRRNDPSFSGYIYIGEDTWHIAALDLGLQNHQINFFDTLSIKQEYLPLAHPEKKEEQVYMPLSGSLYAHLRLFGFGVSVNTVRGFSNYELNPSFEEKHFNNEIFYIHETANKRDSNYWETSRPMLLTEDELRYYNKEDSLEIKRKSKDYTDSLLQKRKKFKVTDLIDGYYFYNPYSKRRYSTNGLLDAIGFNTVEGVTANLRFSYMKGDWKKNFRITSRLRYGFSNQKLNGTLNLNWSLNNQRWERIGIEGGRFISQFNSHEPITLFMNTAYSLLQRENYLKLYQKDYLKLNYRRELVNGVFFMGILSYEDRRPLSNTNNFSFVKETETRKYTSNIPNGMTEPFENHQTLVLDASIRLVFDQKYSTTPYGKRVEGSKYPVVRLNYRKGLPILGSDVDYDFASINVGYNLKMGLLGESAMDIAVGSFLNDKATPFIDYKHFSGNQTVFLNYNPTFGNLRAPLSHFQLLDYYAPSTTGTYLEAHYEHKFNGFLVNKLPIFRRTKFQAVAGMNYLWQEDLQHVELSVGFENIFKVIRVDWVNAYSSQDQLKTGIRMRVGL